MTKIAVTGGAGFIGGFLAEQLVKDGHDVLVMDDLSILGNTYMMTPMWWDELNCKTIIGEFGDCANQWNVHSEFIVFKPEVIYNLAVKPLPQSLEYPRDNFETNTKITLNLLDYVRYRDVRLVQFSSSEVYGTMGDNDKGIDETHCFRPITPYAASKAACDHLVQSYVQTFGIDAVIVRPGNTYGPRQNAGSYAAVIPETLRRISAGEKPVITWDGCQTRDLNYVTDVVDGAITVAKYGITGESYNISSGREVTIQELMDLICLYMGYDGEIIREPKRAGDVRRHLLINTRAKTLGWTPKVTLMSGIEKTVGWWKTCNKN